VEYLKQTLFKEEGHPEAPDAPVAPVAPEVPQSQIIDGDFLKMDLHEVFGGQQFVLTGNYPYDISSQIFFKMLDNRDLIPCCTGMIQHEVAVRMASQPGNKQYGILSVLIQAWYDVEYLFTVEPNVFNPPPKVQSAVIRLKRNSIKALPCDEAVFRRIVKESFNLRRKMLRNSLAKYLNGSQAQERFLTLRPEQLSVDDFVELANTITINQ
jgi:16S rRNA (adenine1518-N6/adenine1519-N6)-dimethyltransferase